MLSLAFSGTSFVSGGARFSSHPVAAISQDEVFVLTGGLVVVMCVKNITEPNKKTDMIYTQRVIEILASVGGADIFTHSGFCVLLACIFGNIFVAKR
jgi:hypothetical protein